MNRSPGSPHSRSADASGKATPFVPARPVPPWRRHLGPAARTSAALMLIPLTLWGGAWLLAGSEHNPDNPALTLLLLLSTWAALAAFIVWLGTRHDTEDTP